MRLLLLLALVAAVRADIGRMLLECPQIEGQEWHLYRGAHEASCLHVPTTKKTFIEAFKECFKQNATLVNFAHKKEKLKFVNDLVVKTNPEATVWYLNPQFVHPKLHEKMPEPLVERMLDRLPEKQWAVMEVNQESSLIKLLQNSAPVERHFVCETQALPVPQRPKFAREPEDMQIGEELESEKPEEGKQRKPIFATFNCRAFALPKPDVHWVMVRQNQTLEVKPIEVTMITDVREALRRPPPDTQIFYDLRRDCRGRPCPQNGVQEPSQLIIVGYSLDTEYSIACVANNSIGSVISREAKIVKAEIETNEKVEEIEVFEGHNVTLPCNVATKPETASVEWVHEILAPGRPPISRTLEQINKETFGSYQQSKKNFELIIDAADPKFQGRFVCNVRMHSLRKGHIARKQVFQLKVKLCQDKQLCGFERREVEVASGYPAALSLSLKSNNFIRQGDDFLIECPCLGKRSKQDDVSVEWDIPAKDPKEVAMHPKGSVMKIFNANVNMNGTYQCRCVRRFEGKKEESEWSHMNISVVPYIAPINHVEVVEAQVGKEAKIECQLPQVEIEGIEIFMTPMRGDRSFMEAMTSDRFELSANDGLYIIRIKEVQPEDAGNYGCRVHVNYFGEWESTDSFYTTLKVLQSK